jgi:integrase
MKRKDEARGDHVVPLPPKLLAMMKEWRRADGDDGEYVCPSPRSDASITREAMEKFYRVTLDLAGKHSPHSWRTVFSTWARDAGKDRDAVEAQLDHITGNATETSYDRAKRLDRRRDLLAWHEDSLLAARDGADVRPIRERKA